MVNLYSESEIFGDIHFTFFGYDRFSASMNMAIDEALKETALMEHKQFVRVYEFPSPAIILAVSDSPECVKERAFSENIELTRRKSGGKPIYTDEKVLAYSIIGYNERYTNVDLTFKDKVHNYFGSKIAQAVKEMIGDGHDVELGKAFAIKVDGKPIAGNAQYPNGDMIFFYHGVLAIDGWDVERVNSLLRIPESDFEKMRSLPSIIGLRGGEANLDEVKRSTAEHLLKSVTNGNYSNIAEQERKAVMEKADDLVRRNYGTREWFLKSDTVNPLNPNSRFCLLYPD